MKKILNEISVALSPGNKNNTECRAAISDLFAIGCWFSINGNKKVGYKLRGTALKALREIDNKNIVSLKNLSERELKKLAEAVKPHIEVMDLFNEDK